MLVLLIKRDTMKARTAYESVTLCMLQLAIKRDAMKARAA